MNSLKKIIISATFLLSQTLFADSLSTKIHNQYTSLRAMGMGDAFTAVADDVSLIYYNPAGFAKKKHNEFQLSLVGAGVTPKGIDFYKDIDEAIKNSPANETDQAKATRLSPILDKYYGQPISAHIQAAELFWIRKNWGISLLPADLSIDITINRQLGGPALDLNVIGDTIFAFGFGGEASKTFSWGITAKGVHRVSVDQNISVLEFAANSNILSSDRFKEGISADADIGLMWSPDWFLKEETKKVTKRITRQVREIAQVPPEPLTEKKFDEITLDDEKAASNTATVSQENPSTVSMTASASNVTVVSETVVVSGTETIKEITEDVVTEEKKFNEDYPLTFAFVLRNVGEGQFTKTKLVNKDATMAPDKMYRTIDLGSHYEFAKFGSLTLRAMLDFRNLLHPEITPEKATHMGVEFDYSPSTWFKTQFRAGMNQMYYTAGTTLLLGIFNIEAATYGEEVGTPSNKVENRVYAAKVALNF